MISDEIKLLKSSIRFSTPAFEQLMPRYTSKNHTAVLTITGPTAVGKTEISLAIAEEYGAEIISADSRQIFRQLNIGSAKPQPPQLARVSHHFINEKDLAEPYSAGLFAKEANERLSNIFSRNRLPIIVGGSTLYLHALQYGIADIPDIDPGIRSSLIKRMEIEGPASLYHELETLDPAAASRMDVTKTQRVIRALEVYYGTGRRLSSYFNQTVEPPYRYNTLVLNCDRSERDRRIQSRVDHMLEIGLLSEVESILEQGYDPSLNALQTIGYREPIAFLKGDIGYDEMVSELKRNTRRYAKRQITWYKRFPEYHWVDANKLEEVSELVSAFLVQVGRSKRWI